MVGSGSSSRAATGKIIASPLSRPDKWPLLSVVVKYTLQAILSIICSAHIESGVASNKLPPIIKAASISPRSAASRHAKVSMPGEVSLLGNSTCSVSCILFNTSSANTGLTPIVPIPWTLLCPRSGNKPENRLPIMPRSKARLEMYSTFATPCL